MLEGGSRNRCLNPSDYDGMRVFLQRVGVCSEDIVPVAEHYHCSLYLLDLNGKLYFSYTPDSGGTRPMYASILGVTYNNHFYAVDLQNTSLRQSLVQRVKFVPSKMSNPLPMVDSGCFVVPKKSHRGRKSTDELFLKAMENAPKNPVLDPPSGGPVAVAEQARVFYKKAPPSESEQGVRFSRSEWYRVPG